MSFSKVRVEWGDANLKYKCRECLGWIQGDYKFTIYQYPLVTWLGSCCEQCVRGMDVVNDYYVECNLYGFSWTFYDLNMAINWLPPALHPRLEKI